MTEDHAQRMLPHIAHIPDYAPDGMEQALILLEARYVRSPGTTLTEEEVRDFIRTTPFADVADQFRDYFLLWPD